MNAPAFDKRQLRDVLGTFVTGVTVVTTRAAGGKATAGGRLVNAIPWLRAADPGLYDALDVPLSPGAGKLGRS